MLVFNARCSDRKPMKFGKHDDQSIRFFHWLLYKMAE